MSTAVAQEFFRCHGALDPRLDHPVVAVCDNPLRWYYGGNESIFLYQTELHIFQLWLDANDHQNHVKALQKRWVDEGGDLPPRNARTKGALEELISEEQRKRFALWAEVIDIQCCAMVLARVVRDGEWLETLGLLQAEEQDFLDGLKYRGNGREAGLF